MPLSKIPGENAHIRHSSARGINRQAQQHQPARLLDDTLTKLVNRWPHSRIDDLMPWAYAKRTTD